MLGVPMLAGEKVLGVIVLWREAVAPFDERTIALVTTFAAQGAIAIQNVQTLARSWRSPAGTSRSSWPACRTSCGRR